MQTSQYGVVTQPDTVGCSGNAHGITSSVFPAFSLSFGVLRHRNPSASSLSEVLPAFTLSTIILPRSGHGVMSLSGTTTASLTAGRSRDGGDSLLADFISHARRTDGSPKRRG